MADVPERTPVFRTERVRAWRQQSQLFDVSYRVARERRGQIALVILGVFLVCALFAGQIAPYGYAEQIRGARLLSPSWAHPLRHR